MTCSTGKYTAVRNVTVTNIEPSRRAEVREPDGHPIAAYGCIGA